eukprot:1862113-Amphidinium_carterae.1
MIELEVLESEHTNSNGVGSDNFTLAQRQHEGNASKMLMARCHILAHQSAVSPVRPTTYPCNQETSGDKWQASASRL